MNKHHNEIIDYIEKLLRTSLLYPNDFNKEEFFQDTMKTLSNIMSETKDDTVFCRSVKVIVLLSKTNPNVESYFKDIAKLTIHWLKDIYSTCQVVEAINELLKIFSMFWRKHVEFTLNLLDNLTTELYILKEDFKIFEEIGDFSRMIDQKDRIICVFCVYSILIESIGHLLNEDEFEKFLLSDDVLETIQRGIIIQEQYKDIISKNVESKSGKALEKQQKKLTKNISLPSNLKI